MLIVCFSSVNGSANKIKLKIYAISGLSKLLAELSVRGTLPL